eukprot:6343717-Heterocapsa_arctica.AAC.1
MIKEEVSDDQNELRDFVDDMVLFKEEETEVETLSGLDTDLQAAKQQLTIIGQVLNNGRADICSKQ